MDVLEAVSSRYSCRAFLPTPVPEKIVRDIVERAARATLTGDVFDDAATGQALLNFFLRGLACGAITAEEAEATGLTREELATRSFPAILHSRQSR